MAWTVEIDAQALRQLKKLGVPEAKRIRGFLRERVAVMDDPRALGRALLGSRFENLWRYRVGDYRVVCELQDKRLVVLVVSVAHRREVYR